MLMMYLWHGTSRASQALVRLPQRSCLFISPPYHSGIPHPLSRVVLSSLHCLAALHAAFAAVRATFAPLFTNETTAKCRKTSPKAPTVFALALLLWRRTLGWISVVHLTGRWAIALLWRSTAGTKCQYSVLSSQVQTAS